jgi:hypothetical protein
MKLLFTFFEIALFLTLSSCATMDIEKCKSTDWEERGQGDVRNRYSNDYDIYLQQCQEFGITPDKSSYEKGFNKGLEEFCTFQNGYLIGNDGHTLPTICPKETQNNFVQGFIQGQSNHDMKKQTEKQNELIEKSLKMNHENSTNRCDYNYQCDSKYFCNQGYCRPLI